MFPHRDAIGPALYGSGAAPPRRPWGLLILCALLGGAIGRYVLPGLLDVQRRDEPVKPRAITPRGDLSDMEKATIALFERASPSVVYINTTQLRQDFFTLNVFEMPRGTGSGFIWDHEGHIVTNCHVIAGADRCMVTLHDGSKYDAELKGVAPEKDIAVLHIHAPRRALTPLPIGTSSDLRVGQSVFAIGNPFGLDYTLTTGVVSALNREIKSANNRSLQGMIQTDAAINPGNSGGPLLDSACRLIGMNTAIVSPTGTSAGIGFAVPVNTINRIVPQLVARGKVLRPGLRVSLGDDLVARRLRIDGVIVVEVERGSEAAKAGLKGIREYEDGSARLGDVIKRVDGKPVTTQDELLTILEDHDVGDVVELTLERDHAQRQVRVKLQAVE